MNLLTTKDAAERLGITVVRVHQLIKLGTLKAEKIGRDYLIQEKDLKALQGRKVGRPRKAA
jgi:excisionase family DNA binding protein